MSKQFYAYPLRALGQMKIEPPGINLHYVRVTSSFEYPQLPGPDYIRLLHLEPGNPKKPSELRGSLKVHKLSDQCEYEAISYAWGEYPESDQTLFLDNQVWKISRNLYVALMAYSYPDRIRILWADAICIDQMDTVDKSQQVSIMASIYSNARRVQAWLAPASLVTMEAMRFMAELASKADSFGVSDEVNQPRLTSNLPSITITDKAAQNLIHDAIKAHVDYLSFLGRGSPEFGLFKK